MVTLRHLAQGNTAKGGEYPAIAPRIRCDEELLRPRRSALVRRQR